MNTAGVHSFCGMQMLSLRFKTVKEAKQQGQARQEAGHDNEAEVLQKLLRLLAGHRELRKHCNMTRGRNVITQMVSPEL